MHELYFPLLLCFDIPVGFNNKSTGEDVLTVKVCFLVIDLIEKYQTFPTKTSIVFCMACHICRRINQLLMTIAYLTNLFPN